MAFGPAFDAATDPTRSGLALTFVLPAQQCDLSCPACIIRQRRESTSRTLGVPDYLRFIDDVSAATAVNRINVQGYEPLLSETWPYTESVLRMAQAKGIPTGIVTNGTRLEMYVAELAQALPSSLIVSLDSSNPEENDRRRGKPGAFRQTLDGTCSALENPVLKMRVSVNSILYPGQHDALSGMPKLLKDLGVSSWSVTPLIRVAGLRHEGGFVQSTTEIVEHAERLSQLAFDEGLRFYIDDEFQFLLSHRSHLRRAQYRAVDRAENLLRLEPGGALSTGRDLLKPIDDSTPRWVPAAESPLAFLRRAVPHLRNSLLEGV